PHRLAREFYADTGTHRGYDLARNAQRFSREELEDVAGARHLADRLGERLAFLARQQVAEIRLARPSLVRQREQTMVSALGNVVQSMYGQRLGRQANFKNAGGDERCCAVALRTRESAHTRGRHGTRRFPIPTRRAVRTEACATLPIALRRMCGPPRPASRIDTRARDRHLSF